MVETMKRRERERIMEEIQIEIQKEKEALMIAEREKLKKEQSDRLHLEEILAENQKLIEVKPVYVCLCWNDVTDYAWSDVMN